MAYSQYSRPLIEATQIPEGRRVYLKCVSKSIPELQIITLLSLPEVGDDNYNHTMPILEVLDDDEDEEDDGDAWRGWAL